MQGDMRYFTQKQRGSETEKLEEKKVNIEGFQIEEREVAIQEI